MRLRSVTIWEKEDVPPMDMDTKSERGPWSYVWGIAPLLLLAALILMLCMGRNKGIPWAK
jgi:hypothetical protein